MELPLFVYGTFRPGLTSEFDIFDLHTEKIASAILPDSSIYITKGTHTRAVAVEDRSENGVLGEIYWIKKHHRSRVFDQADELVAPEVSLVKRTVFNVETGEEVEVLVYMVDPVISAFYENEAERVEDGDYEQYLSDLLDEATGYLDEDCEWLAEDFEERNDYTDGRPMALSDTTRTTKASYTPATKASKTYTPSFRVERGTENSMYVWYVGYGSNMNEDRFLKYMNSGRTGSDKFVASDFDSRRVLIDHGVYFARSGRWGSGGIAFLDVDDKEDEPWYARAYRLTAEQLWSVACQENGSRSLSMDWNNMLKQRCTEMSKSGLYSRVVNLGQIDGEHVFTVTNPTSYAQQLRMKKEPVPHQYLALGMLNPPSHEYLNIINAGVEQVADLEEAVLTPFKAPAVSVSTTKALTTGPTKPVRKPVTSLVPSSR